MAGVSASSATGARCSAMHAHTQAEQTPDDHRSALTRYQGHQYHGVRRSDGHPARLPARSSEPACLDRHVKPVVSAAMERAVWSRERLSRHPSMCFETFPFPEPSEEQREAIGAAAAELDRLREG